MERDKLDKKPGPGSQRSFYKISWGLNFILKVWKSLKSLKEGHGHRVEDALETQGQGPRQLPRPNNFVWIRKRRSPEKTQLGARVQGSRVQSGLDFCLHAALQPGAFVHIQSMQLQDSTPRQKNRLRDFFFPKQWQRSWNEKKAIDIKGV